MMEEALDVDLDGRPPSIFGDLLDEDHHRWPELFVLMPFDKALTPVFEDHVKPVAKRTGLTVGRADDFFSTQSIVREIWSAIACARLVLADCTGRNPNVFYEIGIAHTLGKNTILIAQSIDDVPFDLRHLRVIVYDFTPRGMAAFEKQLAATLGGPRSVTPQSDGLSVTPEDGEIRDIPKRGAGDHRNQRETHTSGSVASRVDRQLVELLVCPLCKVGVTVTADEMGLRCGKCCRIYPIRDGIPVMLVDVATIDASGSAQIQAGPRVKKGRKGRPPSK